MRARWAAFRVFAVFAFQSLVAEGQTAEQILALYPDLEPADVHEALPFAARNRSRTSTAPGRRRMKFLIASAFSPALATFLRQAAYDAIQFVR